LSFYLKQHYKNINNYRYTLAPTALADTSRLRRSVRYSCWPLVPNFPTEVTRLRRSIRCAYQFGSTERELEGSNGAR